VEENRSALFRIKNSIMLPSWMTNLIQIIMSLAKNYIPIWYFLKEIIIIMIIMIIIIIIIRK